MRLEERDCPAPPFSQQFTWSDLMVNDILLTVIRWTQRECADKTRSQEYKVALEQLRAACKAVLTFL
jgi:hypothetical protein